jgi:hypothetical protein
VYVPKCEKLRRKGHQGILKERKEGRGGLGRQTTEESERNGEYDSNQKIVSTALNTLRYGGRRGRRRGIPTEKLIPTSSATNMSGDTRSSLYLGFRRRTRRSKVRRVFTERSPTRSSG